MRTTYFKHDMPAKRGSELTPAQQAEVKRRFIFRNTGEHKSRHAAVANCPPLYKDDAEWLACTEFNIRKDGSLADRGCYSRLPPGKEYSPGSSHMSACTVGAQIDSERLSK